VTEFEALEKVVIAEYGERLREPFTMIDLAQVDDMAVSLYLCQGTMAQHRHLDQDELFLVHSGTISLESEWGTAVLRPSELAVVPKGVGHRSSSLLHSLVLLFQPRLMVNRRNGDRRLFASQPGGSLEKISLVAMGRQISIPFEPVVLTHVDTYALTLTLCLGVGPWQRSERQASLILCSDGHLSLDTEGEPLPLRRSELVVVPKGVPYRLTSAGRALILGLDRHPQPGLPLSD